MPLYFVIHLWENISQTPRWVVVYEGYLREFRLDNLGSGEHRFRLRSCAADVFTAFSDVGACVVVLRLPERLGMFQCCSLFIHDSVSSPAADDIKEVVRTKEDAKDATDLSVSGLVSTFKQHIDILRSMVLKEFGVRVKRQCNMKNPRTDHGCVTDVLI
jgi:hypothetical protein